MLKLNEVNHVKALCIGTKGTQRSILSIQAGCVTLTSYNSTKSTDTLPVVLNGISINRAMPAAPNSYVLRVVRTSHPRQFDTGLKTILEVVILREIAKCPLRT